MIDFERVEDALRMLKKQESLALEDVLGVYLDLCEALEAGGPGPSTVCRSFRRISF